MECKKCYGYIKKEGDTMKFEMFYINETDVLQVDWGIKEQQSQTFSREALKRGFAVVTEKGVYHLKFSKQQIDLIEQRVISIMGRLYKEDINNRLWACSIGTFSFPKHIKDTQLWNKETKRQEKEDAEFQKRLKNGELELVQVDKKTASKILKDVQKLNKVIK